MTLAPYYANAECQIRLPFGFRIKRTWAKARAIASPIPVAPPRIIEGCAMRLNNDIRRKQESTYQ
jgi:hypothetical protein